MVLHIASRRNVDKANYQRGIKIAVLNYLNQSVTKYAIDNANRIICQAQYQNTLLRANYGRSCDLILPNFHPSPEKPIKKKASPIKIVWVANFKRLKQPELFLDLAEKFQGNQLAEFIMIGRLGSGIWQDRLIEKTSRLNNLEYKGELSIDGVNEALNESHIFVNTSQYEGYPNTYIQAWMREVPVVTLNCDPDDVIKTEGLGFHSKTFQQMVQDVATLIENQQLREKMGERARKYAWSTFSVSNIQKFINLIEET
jgi:glycosyltransferase involved in cell wall biosynthesis